MVEFEEPTDSIDTTNTIVKKEKKLVNYAEDKNTRTGKYDNFLLLDFKFYQPNLITSDGYINHYQKVHRDFKVSFFSSKYNG